MFLHQVRQLLQSVGCALLQESRGLTQGLVQLGFPIGIENPPAEPVCAEVIALGPGQVDARILQRCLDPAGELHHKHFALISGQVAHHLSLPGIDHRCAAGAVRLLHKDHQPFVIGDAAAQKLSRADSSQEGVHTRPGEQGILHMVPAHRTAPVQLVALLQKAQGDVSLRPGNVLIVPVLQAVPDRIVPECRRRQQHGSQQSRKQFLHAYPSLSIP